MVTVALSVYFPEAAVIVTAHGAVPEFVPVNVVLVAPLAFVIPVAGNTAPVQPAGGVTTVNVTVHPLSAMKPSVVLPRPSIAVPPLGIVVGVAVSVKQPARNTTDRTAAAHSRERRFFTCHLSG